MNLAPIVLFVYNRPWHTNQVLDSLARNPQADRSIIYINCDGPKEDASTEEIARVDEVRRIVRNERRFKGITVIEQESNKGLARSIIDGVSHVLKAYENVIVLEDDILVSAGFLSYMNAALNLYSEEERVGCIHAWNYDLDYSLYNESTFFLRGADCWGWATWARAWKHFNADGSFLVAKINETKSEYEFNRRGTHDFVNMLNDQISGKNDSWAIRWHASLFINDMFCLHPVRAIVENIGLDNSGTHCGISTLDQKSVDHIKLKKIEVIEDELFFKLYRKNLNGGLLKRYLGCIQSVLMLARKSISFKNN